MSVDPSRQCAPEPASSEGDANLCEHTKLAIRGIAAAARVLSLSERKVWQLVNCNALPHRRVDRAVLFIPRELEAWLDAGCPTQPDAAQRVRAAMRGRSSKGVAS